MEPKKQKKGEQIADKKPDPFDPLGSYTGKPQKPLDEPVQDADDL